MRLPKITYNHEMFHRGLVRSFIIHAVVQMQTEIIYAVKPEYLH